MVDSRSYRSTSVADGCGRGALLPNHDLEFLVHVDLVDKGDTHPEAGEHLEHPAERGEFEPYIVKMNDRAAARVATNVTTEHLPARLPTVASHAVSDLRAARRNPEQGPVRNYALAEV